MRHDLIAERRLIIFDPSPAHGKRSAAEQRDVESAISKSQMRLACRPHELDLFGRDRRCDQTGNKKKPAKSRGFVWFRDVVGSPETGMWCQERTRTNALCI